jgi:hypothetical protein
MAKRKSGVTEEYFPSVVLYLRDLEEILRLFQSAPGHRFYLSGGEPMESPEEEINIEDDTHVYESLDEMRQQCGQVVKSLTISRSYTLRLDINRFYVLLTGHGEHRSVLHDVAAILRSRTRPILGNRILRVFVPIGFCRIYLVNSHEREPNFVKRNWDKILIGAVSSGISGGIGWFLRSLTEKQ